MNAKIENFFFDLRGKSTDAPTVMQLVEYNRQQYAEAMRCARGNNVRVRQEYRSKHLDVAPEYEHLDAIRDISRPLRHS